LVEHQTGQFMENLKAVAVAVTYCMIRISIFRWILFVRVPLAVNNFDSDFSILEDRPKWLALNQYRLT